MIDQFKKMEVVGAYVTAITASEDVDKKIDALNELTKDLSYEDIQACRAEALEFIYKEPIDKNQVN